MSEPSNFGWQLLHTLYKDQFNSKMNVIVVWVHFNLVRRGFKSIGLGEDPKTLPTPLELNDTLPFGWNDHLPLRMRYYHNKHIHLLSIQKPDDDGDIIMNLYRPSDNRSYVTSMNINEIADLNNGTLDDIIPEWRTYLQRIAEDMIDPMLSNEVTKDIQIQTDPADVGGSSTEPMYNSPADIPLPIPPRFSFVPPVGVGSSDLNPLGGGGGMIFQPPGMGPRPFMPDPFLPRGAIPPGARFDPIMPGHMPPMPGRMPPMPGPMHPMPGPMPPMPGPGRPSANPPRNYPDPDHLPPPGYDDMFS